MGKSRTTRRNWTVARSGPGPVSSPVTSRAPSPINFGSESDGISTPTIPPSSPRIPPPPGFAELELEALIDHNAAKFAGSSTPLPPLPDTPRTLSFPNGDIILQSNEGDGFRVHMDILQSVSTYFDNEDGYSIVSQDPGPDIRTRRVDHDTRTLDLLLRFLYPSKNPPSIESTDRAIALMQAAADLWIKCSWIDNAITTYLSSDPHPLRAWAIATRFGYATARREAARRFFETNDDFYNDVPSELEHVNAKQFMELQRAKTRAIDVARNAIGRVEWDCDGCTYLAPPTGVPGHPSRHSENCWISHFLQKISQLNPFSHDATSDVTFELSIVRGGCHRCPESFSSPGAEKARSDLRAQLGDILRSIE